MNNQTLLSLVISVPLAGFCGYAIGTVFGPFGILLAIPVGFLLGLGAKHFVLGCTSVG